MESKMILLGTGGGRHTTMFQARSTGGFLFMNEKSRIHLDPGPGALTNMCNIGYDLRQTDAVIVSHCHPDHYSDAASVIEGMTFGGWVKRGSVYGTKSVIEGEGRLGPCISQYHLSIPESVNIIKAGDRISINGTDIDITKATHSDPCNVGFKIHTDHGILSYVSDTGYTDEIAEQYIGSRILMLPVTTPDDNRINYHLCTDDAIKFVEKVKPELTIFIHLGIVLLKHNEFKQAEKVENATGYRTIAGEDLMEITLGDEISINKLIPKRPEWNPAWDL
ncbi:MAG: MBL fold metallo-hydrolase [Candidatus Methanomethylophilaceae archaeon]|nr:MBL fold metallo-hydrolase [Candidatus Methanomethylophilaceae archaeon]